MGEGINNQTQNSTFPKVVIIVLNWNGWKDTIECLESVFRIDYPNYQVIVVDNGSIDDSVERIKAWAEGEQEVEADPKPPCIIYHILQFKSQYHILNMIEKQQKQEDFQRKKNYCMRNYQMIFPIQ